MQSNKHLNFGWILVWVLRRFIPGLGELIVIATYSSLKEPSVSSRRLIFENHEEKTVKMAPPKRGLLRKRISTYLGSLASLTAALWLALFTAARKGSAAGGLGTDPIRISRKFLSFP